MRNVTLPFYHFLLLLQSPVRENFVSSCVKEIAETYFSPGTISVYYSAAKETPVHNHVDDTVRALMESTQWSLEVTPVTLEPIKPFTELRSPAHSATIIFLGLEESWKQTIKLILMKRILTPETRMLILMKNLTDDAIMKILQYVFLKLRLLTYYGLLISDRNVTLYSFDPFYTQLNLVSIWTGHLETRQLLFPERVSMNFDKFTLRLIVTVTSIYDYTIMEKTCVKNVRAIAASLGLPVYVGTMLVSGGEKVLTDDGELNGILASLNRHEGDAVCADGYYLNNLLFFFSEPLPAIFHKNAYWTLKKTELVTGWYAMVIEFSTTVWMSIFATWLFVSTVFYTYYRLTNSRKPFLKVIFAVFGMYLENPPTNQCGFRCALWLFLLYLVVINTAYKSKIISILINPPHETQIKTLEEGVAAGYSIYLYSGNEEWFKINQNEDPVFDAAAKLGRLIYFQSGNPFQYIEAHPRVIGISDKSIEAECNSNFHKSPAREYFSGTFDSLEGSFWDRQECVYMSSANPLLPIFAKKQQYIIEAGLILYWEAVRLHLMFLQMHEVKPAYVYWTEARPISLTHVSTFFGLFLICIAFCLVCFILEKIVFWYNASSTTCLKWLR